MLFNTLIPQMQLSLLPAAQPRVKPYKVTSAKSFTKFFEPLKLASEEYFLSIHLSSKLEIIGIHEVSHGTLIASLIHPREVFKAACLANSHALILCHNHPSGSLEPSQDDIDVTIRLIGGANILGFTILDHIIIGANTDKYYSFREEMGHLWK